MIRVLIVDDSAVVRELLIFILNSDPDIQVIGAVGDGEEAMKVVPEVRPDVITMDVHMPGINGFETTRRIMETYPTPIVIVSGSLNTYEVEATFHAIEAGALLMVTRPPGLGHPGFDEAAAQLIRAVKAMSEVKVVRRWPRVRPAGGAATHLPAASGLLRERISVVAIGASTGGPMVLQTILAALPKDFPVPLLIVQHMSPGFVSGFADWLSHTCNRPVLVAADGTKLMSGHVYIAPDGYNMGIKRIGEISLTRCKPANGLCPSVAHLFETVASAYGKNAAGVLLTGMGMDGAKGLKQMRDNGAITLAQNEESSVIHGMPGEAIRLGAALHILNPEQIAAALAAMVN